MLTTSSACKSTLILNVYIAKLAVLISIPNIDTIHWVSPRDPWCFWALSPHGVLRSKRRTPFSLARLSNRMGIKDATTMYKLRLTLGDC